MLSCRIAIPFIALLSLLFSSQPLHADEAGLMPLDKWYLTKGEAFEKAKEQGKLIFLLGGRETCPNCQKVVGSINEDETLNTIIGESYVLWFMTWDDVKNNPKAEGYNYAQDILNEGKIKYLPAMFIIDPEKPETSMIMASGFHTAEQLKGLMDIEGRPIVKNEDDVANEKARIESTNTYISGNTLTISNNIANETIRVYTITGTQVASFTKNGTYEAANASSLPKGILIISSSAGWVRKVVNR